MRLADLGQYNPITIQCHDNPDADALGSAYGLYCYFRDRGKQVRMIYSGFSRIQKANLRMMCDKLKLPIEYVSREGQPPFPGLLITVDCQYGAGNVTRFEAESVAVIDHHRIEIENMSMSRIQADLGSCCTLVWIMLQEENYPVNEDVVLGTALYYGLYTDTNQLSEMNNPRDKDMWETLNTNRRLLTMFRNSNLSLQELMIAGIAMIRYSYNDEYRFAVIHSQPCDPNILGLISDFLLQVDEIDVCLVYNEVGDGYKISVRSCIREVNANELAAYLTEGIGSGGGHAEKAGGYISQRLYGEKYNSLHADAYFNSRMNEYFAEFQIIDAREYRIDLTGLKRYRKRPELMGYVRVDTIEGIGKSAILRTQEGDVTLNVAEGTYLVLEDDGDIIQTSSSQFEPYYDLLDEKFDWKAVISYEPTIKDHVRNTTFHLQDYAKSCRPNANLQVYIKQLDKGVKLFPLWDEDGYMLGVSGDYLAAYCDNPQNIFIIRHKQLGENYEEVNETFAV